MLPAPHNHHTHTHRFSSKERKTVWCIWNSKLKNQTRHNLAKTHPHTCRLAHPKRDQQWQQHQQRVYMNNQKESIRLATRFKKVIRKKHTHTHTDNELSKLCAGWKWEHKWIDRKHFKWKRIGKKQKSLSISVWGRCYDESWATHPARVTGKRSTDHVAHTHTHIDTGHTHTWRPEQK